MGTIILEGRFKNLHRNYHKIMQGEVSGSGSIAEKAAGDTHYYKRAELVTSKTHVTGSFGFSVKPDGKRKGDVKSYLKLRK